MSKFKIWILALRAPFFTATLVPIFLGTTLAWSVNGQFNWLFFILTLIGGLALHAGTNLANDYFDHKSRCDEINTEFIRPFTGGSRIIQEKFLTPGQILSTSLISFTIGSLIGLYLTFKIGVLILVFGALGVFSGFFYTAPPIYLAKRGIGEFFVGLNFGVLETLGAYYVQTGSLNWEAALASVPVGFLIAAVLYINQFPDYKADKEVGKNHLVVRLGPPRAVAGYYFLMLGTYIWIILWVSLGELTPWALISLLTFPKTYQALKVAKIQYSHPQSLILANANTIIVHLTTGLLLTGSYILNKLI